LNGGEKNTRHLVENKKEAACLKNKTIFLFAYLHKMNSRGVPANMWLEGYTYVNAIICTMHRLNFNVSAANLHDPTHSVLY